MRLLPVSGWELACMFPRWSRLASSGLGAGRLFGPTARANYASSRRDSSPSADLTIEHRSIPPHQVLKGASVSEPNPSGLSDNAAAGIAYLTFIPAIIFLVVAPYNRISLVRFHAWQSIFLNIAAFVINVGLSVVMGIAFTFSPFLHLALWPLIDLFWFVVWVLCLINAFNGKRFALPVIGALAEQQASKQQMVS
jgi:uncharacterized membrane protein